MKNKAKMVKKILITGATGFVGSNLCKYLKKKGYKIRVFVRNKNKFKIDSVEVFEGDLIKKEEIKNALKGIEIAYYLTHSMKDFKDFRKIEEICAKNFSLACSENKVKRIIYLGGIIDSKAKLSKHLESRKKIGDILRESNSNVTELRASIIIGKESDSFKIIKILVDKISFILWPKWANSFCQPIALDDVLYYLDGCIRKTETKNKIYDIGGINKLRYKELLLLYAHEIKKNLVILDMFFIPKKFYSYGVHIITKQPLYLINSLLESLHNDTTCKDNEIR